MKKIVSSLVVVSVLVLGGCTPDVREKEQQSLEPEVTQITVTNNEPESQEPATDELSEANRLVFDQHEYQYDVVTGATQTTFGTTPPALYSEKEKKDKMFWSNQPPLGLLKGDYYKNEGTFTGGNYGIVEIVTEEDQGKILDVEFTEFASDPYYDTKYSGVNKRLSDYAFFQAGNTRTDPTLVTVVNGITYLEKQMRDENRVTGDFMTVKGSSTSAREGFMPLAAALDESIRKPTKTTYQGYAEELDNGLIGRLEVITTDGKIEEVFYDEYFADTEDKIKEVELKPYYRQSKYYSLAYNEKTSNEFVAFSDQLVAEIKQSQTLTLSTSTIKKHPSYEVYQRLAEHIQLD